LNIWLFYSVRLIFLIFENVSKNKILDSDRCETCPAILEKLETIDDDTDKHHIQFVKTNDVKLAHEIGVFSFPALVYYETGVPIMFDGNFYWKIQLLFINYFFIFLGNLKQEKKVLQWLIDQKSKF
jgi:hypothetical protein